MFEMTISTIKARNKDISFIINTLRSSIKGMKGIMVCEEFDGRVKLAIAVSDNKKDYALSLIFDAVSEAIIRGYKEEFLKKNLKVKLSEKVQYATFIKALTMFDKQGDKIIIKKQLMPCDELNIDSLYNFRLWELEKRWKEICSLVEDNASYLLASGSFSELMKFLIATSEVETPLIVLKFNEGNIFGEREDGKQFFKLDYKKDDNSKIDVLSELIGLAPEKIVIFDENMPADLKEEVCSLFDGRVSIRK